MTQNQISEVIQGGTNVFEDLGFAPEEALNLKIRADLMLNIKRFIQSQGWTQKQAALFFGETQPRISDLINGDIERFSIDKLVMMLAHAGMNVRVEVLCSADYTKDRHQGLEQLTMDDFRDFVQKKKEKIAPNLN